MKVPDMEVPLAMAINEGYALPAACTLYSIGHESPEVVEYAHILASDLTSESREGLKRVAGAVGIQAEIHNSTSALEALGEVPVKTKWSDRMSKDVWARLLISGELEDVERCLYVDADTLCLGSIERLVKADLGDDIVGAVNDVLPPASEMADHLAAKEPGDTVRYFNSGVLLMDCKKWRQHDITPRALDFARQNPDLIRFWDQDALNAVLQGKWKALDGQWNVYPLSDLLRTSTGDAMKKALEWSVEDEVLHKKAEDKARIMHFISWIKPWLPGYPANSTHYDRYQRVAQSVGEILNR
jgi:lipopolysaccharide biosynthesis glycosyltransferase